MEKVLYFFQLLETAVMEISSQLMMLIDAFCLKEKKIMIVKITGYLYIFFCG